MTLPFVLLIAASLGCIGYLWLNLQRLLFDMGFPLTPDVMVGFLTLFVVFVACWLSFGYILPLMAVVAAPIRLSGPLPGRSGPFHR